MEVGLGLLDVVICQIPGAGIVHTGLLYQTLVLNDFVRASILLTRDSVCNKEMSCSINAHKDDRGFQDQKATFKVKDLRLSCGTRGQLTVTTGQLTFI